MADNSKYLMEKDLSLSIRLGGLESGTPTWGTAFTATCSLDDWQDANRSVTIDETDRCDDLVQDYGYRADRSVTLSVKIARAAAMRFGSAVNQHIEITATYDLAGTDFVEVLTGAIRGNNRGSARGAHIMVNLEIRVKSVA